MKLSPAIVAVVSTLVGLAVTVGFVIHEGQQIAEARAAILQLDDKLVEVQRRLTTQNQNVAAAMTQRDALAKAAGEVRRAGTATNGQGGGNSRPTRPDWKALAKDPKFEAALTSNFRSGLHLRYAALYRQLGLTGDQIQQFESALTTRFQNDMDVRNGASGQGIEADDPALKTLFAKNQADQTAALKGIATAQQLDEYGKAQAGRDVSSQLVSALYYTDTPLSPEQRDAVTQLITAHSGGEDRSVDWAAVMTQASGVLSTPQVAMLNLVQTRTDSMQQLNRAFQAAQHPSGGGSP